MLAVTSEFRIPRGRGRKLAKGMKSDQSVLDGMPPHPRLRTAAPSSTGNVAGSIAMPRPSPSALALTGAGPAASLISKMMALEKLVGEISKELPEATNAFAPAIQQMRDLGAARLADQASGGAGATNPEATAPPPGMGPVVGGPAAQMPTGGGAGGGMMPMPMPMI